MSKALENTVAGLKQQISALASLAKVALRSRKPAPAVKRAPESEIVILGNGPSLNDTIAESLPALMSRSRMAVNFAANAPQFATLRPDFYILADPHFFKTDGVDPNVARLWENLRKADWKMTLYVPVPMLSLARRLLQETDIELKGFNMTPAEGARPVVQWLYRKGLAMPRPRNVLIPAIMTAMREGFGRLWIAGADHTWTRTLSVDEQNRVVSVQPHFYKDSKGEQTRVNTEYAGYHLHDILQSMVVAFRSYHQIQDYARRKGVEIYNVTPGSMIDAFERRSL